MTDFIIPKGEDYYFKLKILAKDSIYPQSLVKMSAFEMKIYRKDDGTVVVSQPSYSHTNAEKLTGIINVHLLATQTNLLEVKRSGVVDGYYLKSGYQASIKVTFTDPSIPSIFTTINDIYVSQTGV